MALSKTASLRATPNSKGSATLLKPTNAVVSPKPPTTAATVRSATDTAAFLDSLPALAICAVGQKLVLADTRNARGDPNCIEPKLVELK